MSEYDNLLKSRPELIAEAKNDANLDLENRTMAFKEKLNTLEKAHTAVMQELKNTNVTIIEDLMNSITNLDLDKTDKLKEYESDMANMSKAYELMIQSEIDKQKSLTSQINKAKSEQGKFLANMHNQELNATSDFKEDKERLLSMHNDNLDKSSKDFQNISDKLKGEVK